MRIYGPFIEGILRFGGAGEDYAADVKQEVLLIVVREIPRFEHNGRRGAFRNWLRAITVNRLRTMRHARNRSDARALDCVIERLEDPNGDLVRHWNREHDRYVIHGMLTVVDDEFSAVTVRAFRRTFLDQSPIAQVAEDLGISKNAVIVARSKVLKRLRELGEGMLE